MTAVTPADFVAELDAMIAARKKMTSRLYQIVLAGEASLPLLRAFVIHRYPIKAFWTRNILGIASRVVDYALRRELIENIYEEETGALTGTGRHLESFVDFGETLGLTRAAIVEGPVIDETAAVIAHNVGACNRDDVHFTTGVASVLLLMEGQPAIVSQRGSSMEAVMRDVYQLPPRGYAYFSQHASAVGTGAVSEIEDDHASTARRLLMRYCDRDDLRAAARAALTRAIELRHAHFDAIARLGYQPSDPPLRWTSAHG